MINILIKSNDIIRNSYLLYHVLKIVFEIFLFVIYIYQYSEMRFKMIKCFVLSNYIKQFSILDKKYILYIITLLKTQ